MSRDYNLSELQISTMDALWENGELSVQGVQEALAARKMLAATTVATILKRLEKRGIVGYRKEGRKYIYHAIVAKNEVTKNSISSVIKNLFRGNKAALVNHLLADEDISVDELEQIQKLIHERTKSNA